MLNFKSTDGSFEKASFTKIICFYKNRFLRLINISFHGLPLKTIIRFLKWQIITKYFKNYFHVLLSVFKWLNIILSIGKGRGEGGGSGKRHTDEVMVILKFYILAKIWSRNSFKTDFFVVMMYWVTYSFWIDFSAVFYKL